MSRTRSPVLPIVLSALAVAIATAQQPSVREFEQNGVRYRETRAMVRQPVTDLRYVDRQQIAYQPYQRTEVTNLVQERLVPATQYECVPRLYDWWRVFGVFGQPYVAYSMEPNTSWQRQPISFAATTTRQELIPYTRTVKVAEQYLRFEDKEQITTVALGPASSTQAATPNPPPTYTPVPPPTYAPPILPPQVAATPSYVPGDPYASSRYAPPLAPAIPAPRASAFGNATDGMSFATRAPVGSYTNGYLPPESAAMGYGTATATRPYGGVARLNGDPPRYGGSAIIR